MRRILSGLLVVSLVALSLTQLTACESQQPKVTSTTTVIDPGQSTPLNLEQAEYQLKEKGYTLVNTVEKASQLTGYQVMLPSFTPEGFAPWIIAYSSAYYVYYLGFDSPGAPSQLPEFPYDIQVTYVHNQGAWTDDEPFFMITQSRNKIEGIGKELVNIGGRSGKKQVLPESENNTARLGLSWNDGTMYYVMEATLIDPLDEDTLIKIAASMAIP